MKRAAIWMAALAACTSTEAPPPQGPPPPPAIEPPVAREDPPPDEAGPPEEPFSVALSPVIEGSCPRLDVSLLGGETFVFARQDRWLARRLPDGTFEEVSVVLPSDMERPWLDESIGWIEEVEGEWPDNLWLRYRQIDGRMWEGSRYIRRKDGAWGLLQHAEEEAKAGGIERLYPWTGGNLLGRVGCRADECVDPGLGLRVVRGPGKAPKFPELKSVAESCWSHYAMTVLPGGEIAAVGRFCHKPREAEEGAWYGVFWSEVGGTKIDRLPVTKGLEWQADSVVGSSPDHVFAALARAGKPPLVFAFDGASWTSMAPVEGGPLGALDVDASGTAWLAAGGRLVRSVGAAWEAMSFPKGPVKRVGGLREPVAWVSQQDGTLWLRPPGQDFTQVSLPAPAFSTSATFAVEAVRSAARDLWVTASYTEKGAGWEKDEPRRALLHNGPRRDALRCAQDESYNPKKGLVAWPPAAREGCATPFAILVRAASWTRKDFKYPELGKLLKGKQELAAARFAEVEIGGLRIVGASAPDLATGRALVELVAKGVGRSRPELVCAAPEVKRALPFDLATGKLAP